MGGTTLLEHAVGMKAAHPAAPPSVRRETIPPLDRAEATTLELVIDRFEYAECERQLDRLHAIRARELPDRMRRARGFPGADAAEEIAHIREDCAVVDARIAWLEDLFARPTCCRTLRRRTS
jgi:hypothetical protein